MASASTNFVQPGQQRHLRACMVCSIVLHNNRFKSHGCPNCEEFLQLANDQEQIESCTSQVFEGLIAIGNPSKSWVAKWQRLDKYVPGMYATKVSGQLPDDVRSNLEESRVTYIPRDGSALDTE